MILAYIFNVDETKGLRKILSQNIRNARALLHISQAKLAEDADISFSHMVSIEYCKSWVSDSTLQSLAKALNMEAWELLSPAEGETRPVKKRDKTGDQRKQMKRIADLIIKKREILHHAADKAMEDLIMEILREK